MFYFDNIINGSAPKAKYLRKIQTKPECLLWKKLRAYRFHGLKFRRQVPIGPYVADFACIQWLLIIEVDGSSHQFRKEHDMKRDKYLEELGFSILRFKNHQVEDSMNWVLQIIREHIKNKSEELCSASSKYL